ncbi:MAG: hypothetical protein V1886_00065 [archaeon]
MTKETNSKEDINEKLKELVITRIEAQMPSNLKLSMGSCDSLTKGEMIKHVQAGDEQGQQIVNMHLNFIRALTSRKLITEVNKVI